MSPSSVKILVLPVASRQWLFHAWQDPAQLAAKAAPADWRAGANLEERLSRLGTATGVWLEGKLQQQWRGLEAAREGSLKHRLYRHEHSMLGAAGLGSLTGGQGRSSRPAFSLMRRLAQWVLAKEDPQESFLKSVPASAVSVDIIYPSSWDERMVRRRMRHMLQREGALFSRRKWLWALACVPLIPLLATPLPNIPLYYAGYKVYSASRAGAGASALEAMWQQRDTRVLQKLREQLLAMQAQGVVFPAKSWPARLMRPEGRYKGVLDNIEGRMRHYYRGEAPEHRIPRMQPSRQLDALLAPAFRSSQPIDDDIIKQVGSEFQATLLMEHATRARRLVLKQQAQ